MSLEDPGGSDSVKLSTDEIAIASALLAFLVGCLALMALFMSNGAQAVLDWLGL